MNSVGSNNLSLKCQRFTPTGCKDIGIKKFEFVAETQFLLEKIFFIFEQKILNFFSLCYTQGTHGVSLKN